MTDYHYKRTVVYHSPGWFWVAVYVGIGFAVTYLLTGNIALSLFLAVIWPLAIPFLIAATSIAVFLSIVAFILAIAALCWLFGD